MSEDPSDRPPASTAPVAEPGLHQLRAETDHLLEALRAAEEARDHYGDLYNQAPLPLVTFDIIGVIHELNLAAAALLGSENEPRSVIGKRLKSFVIDADRPKLAAHLRMCSTSDNATCSIHLTAPNGRVVPVQLWSRRGQDPARLCQTAILDISEQEEAADEIARLRDAQQKARAASDAKDQFIAMLSHELRTPLTPVLAAVSALAGRADTPPALRSLCEMIQRNILTEARLIDGLLDVTRIVRGKVNLERVLLDVHETAQHALEMVTDEIRVKQLTVVVALEAECPFSHADPVRMRQVFWNLLRNAVKFSRPGGRIELHSWNRGGRLAIEISDTGIGFASADTARLFQAFEQDPDAARQHGGLGLGLAICKGLVELHGGTIEATSRGLNQGARFIVELAAVAAARVRPSILRAKASALTGAEPGMPRASAMKPRLLLVEDDPDTTAMLRDILSDAGYQVRTASSTQAALAEELETIDIVLSDIGLPDGSGLDLMRQLRNKRAIKGIALSGYGTEADKRASLQAGFSAHLTKPIEIDGLLQAIAAVGTGGIVH